MWKWLLAVVLALTLACAAGYYIAGFLGIGASLLVSILAIVLVRLTWDFLSIPDNVTDADHKRLSLRHDTIKTMGQLVGGFAVVCGLVMTWQQMTDAQLQFDETRQSTAKEMALSRTAQLSQRFSAAVTQLRGSESPVQMGAIYTLEHLAQGDPEIYAESVVEILAAFVRESDKPSAAVRAALIVLGRRHAGATRIPLLTGAKLSGLDLADAKLRALNLREADFSSCNLSGVDLTGSILIEANLADATLVGTTLIETDCNSAVFDKCNLVTAQFHRADCDNASFDEAELVGAGFDKTILRNAHLGKARKLTQPQLDNAYGNGETEIPPRAKAPNPLVGERLCLADVSLL